MKIQKALICALLLVSGQLFSQVIPGEVKSFRPDGQDVIFECQGEVQAKISILAEDVFRVQMSDQGQFDRSMMVQWDYVNLDWPEVDFLLEEDRDEISILTSALQIIISKSSFSIRVENLEGGLVLKENDQVRTHMGEGNRLVFDMPADEHFFGFGFMRKTLDARGSKLTWTRGYRWKEATVPFFMSTRGYGFYSNNTWNHDFDFTAKSSGGPDYYTIESTSGNIDYFIFYGPSFRKILDSYTDLTGKSDLVPRWAFGLEYRFRYLGEQDEFLDIAREFRKREIPCDIMALEPGWEEEPYSMIWEWGETRFPDGPGMIRQLDDMGFKLDLWESGIAPKTNITDPKVRKQWYAKRASMVDQGVRMFKQDDPYPRSIKSTELLDPVFYGENLEDILMSAEQLNNVSNTLYTETLFDEFRKQTGERAVVMFHAYNASVASQRWPFQWAGDFQAAYGMLNASLSGHAMVSYDIRNPYAAGWHQGFFTPFSVVDAWAYYREPWLYSQSMEESHRLYACLRSRLVPYFYSSLWQARKEALPIERPMVLDRPHDPMTYQMKSQFMVGDWFLLGLSDSDDAPAGEKVDFWSGERKGNEGPVYLPEGTWIDYWTGEEHSMKDAAWIMGSWPEYMGGHLFVKAGAIIPMGQVKNYIGETDDEIVILDIYPHGESAYRLYEDDGISYDYEDGAIATTDYSCQVDKGRIEVLIGARQGQYENMPIRRSHLLKVFAKEKPAKVFVDSREITYFANPAALVFDDSQAGWYYDAAQKKAIIKMDAGWKYEKGVDGRDPLGIMPLTASQERISWKAGAKVMDMDREVVISLPRNPIPELQAQLAALPADGISRSRVDIGFRNGDPGSGKLKARLEGPLSFENGSKERELSLHNGRASVHLVAGEESGTATLRISGSGIEDGMLEIPVYGNPVSLHLVPDQKYVLADGGHQVRLGAILKDEYGQEVLDAPGQVILQKEGDGEVEADTAVYLNGKAVFMTAAHETGQLNIRATYGNIRSDALDIPAVKGEMQVRINPPEWIKLRSGGNWIPKHVTVFVNIMHDGKVVRNASNKVFLKVYDRNMKLLYEYEQSAVKGELAFKDISYDKRPADYYFEVSAEGYEPVIKKVYENTWDEAGQANNEN